MRTLKPSSLRLSDDVGLLTQKVTDNWLIGLRQSNPAILDMFYERDRKPYRDLLPWSGEFAGKHLTAAYYIYQLNRDPALLRDVQCFLDELLTCIDEDGYIGCFQKACHLTGAYSQTPGVTGTTWDAWSHYHIMYGFYLWFLETGQPRLWEALERIAGLFERTFYHSGRRLSDIGSTEMNLAPYHMFALLYQKTGARHYLDFALQIEGDFAHNGNYLSNALGGLPFYRSPKPRWESLHILMGFPVLYRATGCEDYLRAADQIFRSILGTDVHNTGGFSTEERAIGTPFVNGIIELCCVVAFNAFAADLFLLLEDSSIADFLEFSLYNAVMGSFSPSGRWSTYSTPMEGEKIANYHGISFQGRPGSPELNCCSVNAPRGIGTLAQWMLTEHAGTVYLNYYGAFSCETDTLRLAVSGDYPAPGTVVIRLRSAAPKAVCLRIPAWSKYTAITLDGEEFYPTPGTYWRQERLWQDNMLTIRFDFTPYLLDGAGDYAGKCSICAGPLLFGLDQSLPQPFSVESLPLLSRKLLQDMTPVRREDRRIALSLPNGLKLIDFYHLGQTGSSYKTWFPFQKDGR